MPLTDLVRYFNAADQAGDSTLYLDGERAAAWHDGCRLGSLFEPIVELASGRVVGHRASLDVRADDGAPRQAADLYAACATPAAIVAFDRLSRTLHALNFLAQRAYAGGYLQVPVHPRHLLAVPNQHGLVYEAILKRCGLAPDDIVLEIGACAPELTARLAEALDAYRLRGYRLALQGEALDAEGALLASLRPAIVCGEGVAAGWTGLRQIDGVAEAAAAVAAREAGYRLAAGPYFGLPEARCRATHSRSGVAYNAGSTPGAPT